jgi:hypothetical protein
MRCLEIALGIGLVSAAAGCGQRTEKTARSTSDSRSIETTPPQKYDTAATESTPTAGTATERAHTESTHTEPTHTELTPADVVRRYYAAIGARQYRDAYRLWAQSGKASGKSEADFAAGFAQTVTVSAALGDSARIEGAAGSEYAMIPLVVDAVLRDGIHQHFVGTYALRRSMVDGATPEQRRWRIYSADLQRAQSSVHQ